MSEYTGKLRRNGLIIKKDDSDGKPVFLTFSKHDADKAEAEALAARLVACWNTLAGIPTEELEYTRRILERLPEVIKLIESRTRAAEAMAEVLRAATARMDLSVRFPEVANYCEAALAQWEGVAKVKQEGE